VSDGYGQATCPEDAARIELELSPGPHVDLGEAMEQDVQRDLGLEPGEWGTKAEVDAVPEGQVLVG
jgi:hypothetical protein